MISVHLESGNVELRTAPKPRRKGGERMAGRVGKRKSPGG